MVQGLRERKKQATRAHISAVATRLFVEQGFEATTIAQIAEQAEVAKMTVTNYFPLKEDLFFDRAPEIVALLADVVTGRPAGTTPAAAVCAAYLEGLDARWPPLGFGSADFTAAIAASPALQARGRSMLAEQEEALAAVLVAEARAADPDDDGLDARLEAARLAGIVRVLVADLVGRVQAGEPEDAVLERVRRAAREYF
ncbi:TetR/AcrR family transcriptional regulator [Actinomycetospora soli]|uniref:TetR/AcrR family transcriptional regulator n=1 Tax=Actinomycetospora soli TaxID=2893887 RepID=UPI001E32544D|nr:TetR/AcrR family transcriptional regulator [Actinomycetospora soli]MCD2189192.1 TetR/AcrR family transcriptional regulator [Actinomycetospora soli]